MLDIVLMIDFFLWIKKAEQRKAEEQKKFMCSIIHFMTWSEKLLGKFYWCWDAFYVGFLWELPHSIRSDEIKKKRRSPVRKNVRVCRDLSWVVNLSAFLYLVKKYKVCVQYILFSKNLILLFLEEHQVGRIYTRWRKNK